MSIRPYQTEDETELLNVWYTSAVIAHNFLPAEHFERERRAIATTYLPMAETWVYVHQGKVVAFISMLGNAIGGLFVEPAMQGFGVGRSLVDHVRALRGELEVEVFEQNEQGRKFYEIYGFAVYGRAFHTDSGAAILQMRLP